jgi:hypothetical protein
MTMLLAAVVSFGALCVRAGDAGEDDLEARFCEALTGTVLIDLADRYELTIADRRTREAPLARELPRGVAFGRRRLRRDACDRDGTNIGLGEAA